MVRRTTQAAHAPVLSYGPKEEILEDLVEIGRLETTSQYTRAVTCHQGRDHFLLLKRLSWGRYKYPRSWLYTRFDLASCLRCPCWSELKGSLVSSGHAIDNHAMTTDPYYGRSPPYRLLPSRNEIPSNMPRERLGRIGCWSAIGLQVRSKCLYRICANVQKERMKRQATPMGRAICCTIKM